MITFDASDRPHPFVIDEALSIQPSISIQPSNGLLRFHPTHRLNALPQICFTEIDQAFLLWGALTVVIFSLGQFSPLSWSIQAIIDAALTGVGIALTSGITWAIACQAKLRWVVLLWALLMSAGTVATAYAIFYSGTFYSGGLILANLCLLWLALCAAGYGVMSIGMQSRCFTAACLVHLAAIAGLSYLSSWQFFGSGLIMASTLFFFSVVPWDRQESN